MAHDTTSLLKYEELEMTTASAMRTYSLSGFIAEVRDEFVAALRELGLNISVILDNRIPECTGQCCVRLDSARLATARTQTENMFAAQALCGTTAECQAVAARLMRILQQLQGPTAHVTVHLHGSAKSLSVQFFRCMS